MDNQSKARTIALKLVDSLGDQQSLKFYLKVAWNLPEHVIWSTLETAQTKRKPAAYFSTVCKAHLAKLDK